MESTTDKYANLSVSKDNTLWVFISGHTGEEDILDILWCSQQLASLGVGTEDILIFSDHPKSKIHLEPLLKGSLIGELDSFLQEFPKLVKDKHEHIMAVIAGHGGHVGVLSYNGTVFKPHPIVQTLKSGSKVKSISLVLGQCYAGVFNYLNVRGAPPVCIIGATNLHLSLANPTVAEFLDINGNLVKWKWVANMFLLRYFDWLKLRNDIDGDGVVSVLDGYRHAAILSNDELRELKNKNTGLLRETEVELEKLKLEPESDLILARMQALKEEIENLKMTITHHQEPWVLHPDLARSIKINL